MRINPASYSAFADEFLKISAVAPGVGNAASKVWHGLREAVGTGWRDAGGLLPHQVPTNAAHAANLASAGRLAGWTGVGKYTRFMPVGGKSLMVGMTIPAAMSAMKKQDPTGMEKSRAERATGLAGNILGGLAGAGLALSTGTKHTTLAPLVGGIVGGTLGEKVLSSPFAAARNMRQTRQRNAYVAGLENQVQQQQPQQAQPSPQDYGQYGQGPA